MNGRTRTLLAMALGVALAAPAAMAQVKIGTKVTGNAGAQVSVPRPTLPTQAAPRATEAVQKMTTQRPTATPPADATDFKEARNAANTPTAQVDAKVNAGASANAAAHSTAAQRSVWTRLDADADGRISTDEAAVDTDFNGGFAMMDTDHDGFVSDAEFRAHAKLDASQGAANAAAHSMVVTREVWTRLDADADGRISADEADADASFDGMFSMMDTDGDGFVSEAEYRAHAKVDTSQGAANAAAHSMVVTREVWTRLDADADGRISADEADADASFDGMFSMMDTDGDGFVSEAEYRAHAKVDTAQGADHAAGHSMAVTKDTWARLDADADGRISTGEADVDTGFDAGFAAMDADEDGFVTEAEFRTHAKAKVQP